MPRFAANLSFLYPELPFLDRFAAAARSGFRAVEFLFPYEHAAQDIARRLQDGGLELVLHNLPPGDWAAGERGLACHPGREDEFRAGVALAVEYAAALGPARWHCMAGLVPPGVSHAQARATWVANVRYAATEAKRLGIQLLIEPINCFDMPGYFLTRARQAIELIDEVGMDQVYLQYDLYHAQRMGDGLTRSLQEWLPRIGHIQLADTPDRHEPGTGVINFRSLFDQLDRLGYPGWVGCEYKPQDASAGGTDRGLTWVSTHGQKL